MLYYIWTIAKGEGDAVHVEFPSAPPLQNQVYTPWTRCMRMHIYCRWGQGMILAFTVIQFYQQMHFVLTFPRSVTSATVITAFVMNFRKSFVKALAFLDVPLSIVHQIVQKAHRLFKSSFAEVQTSRRYQVGCSVGKATIIILDAEYFYFACLQSFYKLNKQEKLRNGFDKSQWRFSHSVLTFTIVQVLPCSTALWISDNTWHW